MHTFHSRLHTWKAIATSMNKTVNILVENACTSCIPVSPSAKMQPWPLIPQSLAALQSPDQHYSHLLNSPLTALTVNYGDCASGSSKPKYGMKSSQRTILVIISADWSSTFAIKMEYAAAHLLTMYGTQRQWSRIWVWDKLFFCKKSSCSTLSKSPRPLIFWFGVIIQLTLVRSLTQ